MSGDEIEYCGGEMDGWSDPVTADDVLVTHARRMLPDDARRVLLLGGRAAGLTRGLLDEGREVTVLVRGTQDATRLAAEGAGVVCGSFDSWRSAQRFDCAISLDPPHDLLAASSDGLGALELVARVSNYADTQLVHVENAAAATRLDATSTGPSSDTEFAVGSGYDPRPPVLAELDDRPLAAVFTNAVASTHAAADPRVRTLLRSLLADDLRYDALLADPLAAADGWLVGSVPGGPELTYRRLDGGLAESMPESMPESVPASAPGGGTPVETRLRQLLLRGDLVRVRAGLQAYAHWADGAPAPLLRNLIAAERTFAPIDEQVTPVELPVAMLDLASVLGRTQHPFGGERSRDEIATELLRLAVDLDDPDAQVAAAAPGYDASTLARSTRPESEVAGDLVMSLRVKDAQVAALQADLAKDRRHLRALEHALATEAGPRAKRAYFLMTAPTKRLIEAARRRR